METELGKSHLTETVFKVSRIYKEEELLTLSMFSKDDYSVEK